jgi:hypothetical protein
MGWRIRFGIIIGGTSDQTDNLSWTRAGLGQLQSLAANPTTVPEDIIIQSWQPLPTQYLGNRSRNEHLDATSGRTDGSMSAAR